MTLTTCTVIFVNCNNNWSSVHVIEVREGEREEGERERGRKERGREGEREEGERERERGRGREREGGRGEAGISTFSILRSVTFLPQLDSAEFSTSTVKSVVNCASKQTNNNNNNNDCGHNKIIHLLV